MLNVSSCLMVSFGKIQILYQSTPRVHKRCLLLNNGLKVFFCFFLSLDDTMCE